MEWRRDLGVRPTIVSSLPHHLKISDDRTDRDDRSASLLPPLNSTCDSRPLSSRRLFAIGRSSEFLFWRKWISDGASLSLSLSVSSLAMAALLLQCSRATGHGTGYSSRPQALPSLPPSVLAPGPPACLSSPPATGGREDRHPAIQPHRRPFCPLLSSIVVVVSSPLIAAAAACGDRPTAVPPSVPSVCPISIPERAQRASEPAFCHSLLFRSLHV